MPTSSSKGLVRARLSPGMLAPGSSPLDHQGPHLRHAQERIAEPEGQPASLVYHPAYSTVPDAIAALGHRSVACTL